MGPTSWATVKISAGRPDAWQSPRSDPAPQKTPRRKFVASVTFLSFKSRERWHDPPCKRTAMRPVHWSAQVVVVVAPRKDATMKIPGMKYGAGRGPGRSAGVAVAVLLAAGAVSGWGLSTAFGTRAAAVESQFELTRNRDAATTSLEAAKANLVGSYVVTGTDPDGKSYVGTHILDVSMAPSGALELDWDNGKQVGVGQVIGNFLAVACLIKGRTVILTMAINPDGSLSGKWSRRTDRGWQGTEAWART